MDVGMARGMFSHPLSALAVGQTSLHSSEWIAPLPEGEVVRLLVVLLNTSSIPPPSSPRLPPHMLALSLPRNPLRHIQVARHQPEVR